MQFAIPCRRFVWTLGFATAVAMLAVSGAGGARAAGRPSFEKIKAVTLEHFQQIPEVQQAVILAQPEVATLFPKLQQIGWSVPDAKEIVEDVLPPDDFLVKELRTKKGAAFSRQIARYPQAYDRLDRYRHLVRGHQLVKELIRGPDGYKLIEYMTTSKGGKNLGKQLSHGPHGEDFNKPTGRIYMVDDLLERLKVSYADSQR